MTNAEARFNKIHIRKVYASLAVTCHLHFWQNDRDFLRATVVTRGWNGYRNKSQHRKSTLEKKILPPFQQGFEPATFQSRVRRSNHWDIPAPVRLWGAFNILYYSVGMHPTLHRRSHDVLRPDLGSPARYPPATSAPSPSQPISTSGKLKSLVIKHTNRHASTHTHHKPYS